LLAQLAECQRDTGAFDAAFDTSTLAMQACSPRTSIYVQAALTRARSLTALGRTEQAFQTLNDALRQARKAGAKTPVIAELERAAADLR
jgi:tetratricopeptide (TPR) repeat protein